MRRSSNQGSLSPVGDKTNAGDEGRLGENWFERPYESKDLWKFGHGDLLLQSALSTPSKRIAMPFLNLYRKTRR
jgi:hypothetical protein